LQQGVQCNTQHGIINDFDKHFTANGLYTESTSFKSDVMRMNDNEPTGILPTIICGRQKILSRMPNRTVKL
jgi:hypothetical protein